MLTTSQVNRLLVFINGVRRYSHKVRLTGTFGALEGIYTYFETANDLKRELLSLRAINYYKESAFNDVQYIPWCYYRIRGVRLVNRVVRLVCAKHNPVYILPNKYIEESLSLMEKYLEDLRNAEQAEL